jgi:hypothetical protein
MEDTVLVARLSEGAILLSEIGRKMCAALDQGNAVVSVATGRHRRLLEAQLTAHGIDIVAALSMGQYVSLNALGALSKIIVDRALDVIRFAEVIGALVDRTAARYPRVLIFGELVPLMLTDGPSVAANELETIWRSFTAARPVFQHCECTDDVLEDYRSLSFVDRATAARDRVEALG